ncbi:MAG: hypothetical protein NT002_01460 [candidate division Zixibacteria bacterium]|jgi:hypothetical protein|nr:hypothetical protein [candidate division Zixibacteria bacterium]
MKRQIPLIFVFAFGMVMIIQSFVPNDLSLSVNEFLLKWIYIIGIFALALGIWSLVRVSMDKIRHKRLGWQYSIVLLLALFSMLLFGFDYGRHFTTTEGLRNYMFVHFFDNILIPVQATMFALLAFFIASASYRAFRARSVLATLLLIAALIVMLRFNPYLGPVGAYMEKTASWLLNVPNLAAKRAIIIGVGLGAVATAMKVMLGIERAYLGKD